MSKLNTINVIEYASGAIQQVFSYENTDEGIKEAEEMFVHLAVGNGMNKDDTEYCLDDGLYEQEEYQVFITHSTKYDIMTV